MKSIVEEASSVMKAIEKGWTQAGKPREFSVKVYEEGVKNFIGMSVEPAKIGIFFEERMVKSAPTPKKEHHQQASRKEQPAPRSSQSEVEHRDRSPRHQEPRQAHAEPRQQHRSQDEVNSTPRNSHEVGQHKESRPQRTNHAQRSHNNDRHHQQHAFRSQGEAGPVPRSSQGEVGKIDVRPRQESVAMPERHEQPETGARTLWSDELIDAARRWINDTLVLMGKSDKTFSIEAKKYHLIVTFTQPVFEDKEQERALFRSFAHLIMQSLRNHFKKGFRGFRIVLNSGGQHSA